MGRCPPLQRAPCRNDQTRGDEVLDPRVQTELLDPKHLGQTAVTLKVALSLGAPVRPEQHVQEG